MLLGQAQVDGVDRDRRHVPGTDVTSLRELGVGGSQGDGLMDVAMAGNTAGGDAGTEAFVDRAFVGLLGGGVVRGLDFAVCLAGDLGESGTARLVGGVDGNQHGGDQNGPVSRLGRVQGGTEHGESFQG